MLKSGFQKKDILSISGFNSNPGLLPNSFWGTRTWYIQRSLDCTDWANLAQITHIFFKNDTDSIHVQYSQVQNKWGGGYLFFRDFADPLPPITAYFEPPFIKFLEFHKGLQRSS